MSRLIVLASAVLLSYGGAGAASEFSYNGDAGPAYWADLDAAWQACGEDSGQSPIAIARTDRGAGLGTLQSMLELDETPIHLMNNGHTLENEYEPGSSIMRAGVRYDLKQFHFHTLSEHSIGDERGAMEMHAVFKDAASDSVVVIGQLFRIGAENEFLVKFDSNLPVKAGQIFESESPINVGDGFADLRNYFTYRGSLTTPPCSPIVTWIVLENWATMSAEQFARFNNILGNNFRPQQPLAERTVLKVTGR